MRLRVLDLNALRHPARQDETAHNTDFPEALEAGAGGRISRRTAMGVIGAASAGLVPLAAAIDERLIGPFRMERATGRVSFWLGSERRWTVEQDRFDGRPKLTVNENRNRIRVALRDALWPGTTLPADFECVIARELFGWNMDITVHALGARTRVPFVGWLTGAQIARASARLATRVCELGSAALEANGLAEAFFLPDWRWMLCGRHVAHLRGIGRGVVTDRLELGLVGPDERSVLRRPPARRTLISMARGQHRWMLGSSIPTPSGAVLLGVDEAVSRLRVETGLDERGRTVSAAVAEGTQGRYRPGTHYRDPEGKQVEFGLSSPRYAVSFHRGKDEHAFVADLADEPKVINAGACALRVSGQPDSAPLEIVASDGDRPQVTLEPTLLGLSAPLPDAVARESIPLEDIRVGLGEDGSDVAQFRPRMGRGAGARPRPSSKVKEQRTTGPRTPQVPLDKLLFPVFRPADMLALVFRFRNMRLSESPSGLNLMRERDGQPCYVTVIFPPQHVAEEVRETGFSPSNGVFSVQVDAALAGRSRLVFRLPDDFRSMPFALSALLDWSQWQLSVHPNALEPGPRGQGALPGLPLRDRLYVPMTPTKALNRPIRPIGRPAPTFGTRTRPRLAIPPGSKPQRSRPGQPRPNPRTPNLGQPAPPNPGRATVKSPGRGAATRAIIRRDQLPVAGLLPPGYVLPPQPPSQPNDTQTAIELPYRLILCPNSTAGWVHTVEPVERGGRTEVWHTTLGVRLAGGRVDDMGYVFSPIATGPVVTEVCAGISAANAYRTLRAVWDLKRTEQNPFDMALKPRNRRHIVTLTGDRTIDGWEDRTIKCERLMLSSLGAWFKVHLGPVDLDTVPMPQREERVLSEWKHIATMGRDNYVKVVEEGFLYPFGHAASAMEITERVIDRVGEVYVAYLRKREFIVVRQRDRFFPRPGQADKGLGLPFTRLSLVTEATPDLSRKGPIGSLAESKGFWPQVGGRKFEFEVEGLDRDGKLHEFSLPLIFLYRSSVDDPSQSGVMQAVHAAYNAAPSADRETAQARTALLGGQSVAFADSTDPTDPGDTSFETEAITFGGHARDRRSSGVVDPGDALNRYAYSNRDEGVRGFYPHMCSAAVRLPIAREIMGRAEPTLVCFAEKFLGSGFGGDNAGEAFLKLEGLVETGQALWESGAPVALLFPESMTGGMFSPNTVIRGLSRKFGPIGGDLAQFAAGTFDPDSFFAGIEAKILGAIDLAKIIDIVELIGQGTELGDDCGKVPKFTVKPVFEGELPIVPSAVEVTIEWCPQVLREGGIPIFKPYKMSQGEPQTEAQWQDRGCRFKLKGKMRRELPRPGQGQGAAQFEMTASLTNFTVALLNESLQLISIEFDELGYYAQQGSKGEPVVKLARVGFGNLLKFVQALQETLGSDALGSFNLSIDASGITVELGINVPNVSVGAMSLQNMSVSTRLMLSFTGKPLTVRFAFCERFNPFLLTVQVYAGGGFLAVTVSPGDPLQRLQELEACFEFGGNFLLDCGVASGNAYLLAGIYFKVAITNGEPDPEITGYIRCGANLLVMELVTVAAEFYMGLTYEINRNVVWGEARVTIKIEVAVFEKEFEFSVRHEFAGGGGGGHTSRSLDGVKLAAAADSAGSLAQLWGQGRRLRPPRLSGSRAAQPWKARDAMSREQWSAYCRAFAREEV